MVILCIVVCQNCKMMPAVISVPGRSSIYARWVIVLVYGILMLISQLFTRYFVFVCVMSRRRGLVRQFYHSCRPFF